MSAIRDIWTQLIEKRLWPLALVLVVALVAVPVVLSRSPDETADGAVGVETPPVVAAAAAAISESSEALVTLAGERGGATLRGRVKDPFRQRLPRVRIIGGGPGAASDGDGGETLGPGDRGGFRGRPDEDKPETFTYATIDVTFGEAGGRLRTIRAVPRLTALPSNVNPVVIFLGMRGDHQTAVFLVSTDVHAQGDIRCLPSPQVCETIELRQDGVAFLDVRDENGKVTQYELNLVAVEVHETTSREQARRTQAQGARAALRALREDAPRSRSGRARATRAIAPEPAAEAAALTPLP